MVTYEKLPHRPQAAPSLIGMTVGAFDQMFAEFAVAHAQRLANLTVTKRKGTPRQRAVGARGKHRYSLRDRLLQKAYHRLPARCRIVVEHTLYHLFVKLLLSPLPPIVPHSTGKLLIRQYLCNRLSKC